MKEAFEFARAGRMRTREGYCTCGGGGYYWIIYETKKPQSTLLAENTQGLITTTKNAQTSRFFTAAPHPITRRGGGELIEGEYEREREREREKGMNHGNL